MVILIVLEKKTKKVATRKNVKIGNLIVDKVNVFSNHGNVTEKKTVHLELMKIIVQTSHLMRIVKRMGILTCPIFQIPLSAMNGRLNVTMVNVFHIGGNVMVVKVSTDLNKTKD